MQTEKNIWLKVLSMILTLALLISCVPNQVYAMAGEALADLLERGETVETIETPNNSKRGVYEVVERREANVKHFALEDGSYTAVMYNGAVHTQDAEGNWQDIDNRLSDSGSEFSTSNARIKFAKKITGNENLFTLHDGNRKITMSLNNAVKKTTGAVTNHTTEFDSEATQLQKLMTLDNLSSEILYADILDGVDLQYVITGTSVKENIIIKEEKENYSFAFTLKLNNMEARLQEDNSITIYDSRTGEAVYIIPNGYMYDANYEFCDGVTYELLSQGNGSYLLTVSADSDWINRADRAFPVYIDPPILAEQSDAVFQKTSIHSAAPNSNGYGLAYLSAGNLGSAYIKMTSLPTLPEGAYISYGVLQLCQHYMNNSEQNASDILNLGAFQVTKDWNPTTFCYNEYEAGSAGTTAYEACDAQDGMNDVSTYRLDIGPIFREWYEHPERNYGIAIKAVNPTEEDHMFYFTLGGYSHYVLRITYHMNGVGLEDYWSFSSQSAMRAGTGYVNIATGALAFAVSTISSLDGLFSYTPTLIYNNHYAGKYFDASNADIPYMSAFVGYGFKLNMCETVVSERYYGSDGKLSYRLVWNDADGTAHYFYRDKTDDEVIYKDNDGLQLTLSSEEDYYELTDPNYTVRRFLRFDDGNPDIGAGGILESIEDCAGNKLRFVIGNRGEITSAQLIPYNQEAVTIFRFEYNSAGLLGSIYDGSLQNALYLYYSADNNPTTASSNGTGYLTRIAHKHQNQTVAEMQYSYDQNGRLICACDVTSDRKIHYVYDGNSVVEVYETNVAGTQGQKVTFAYSGGHTEIRSSGADDIHGNNDDIINTYIFDDQFRLMSGYSMNSNRTKIYGAVTGEYEEKEAAKNSIKSAAIVGGTVSGYLANGGFEYGMEGWYESGDFVCQDAVFPQFGNLSAFAHIQKNSTNSLYQYVHLPAGEYTLAMKMQSFVSKEVRAYIVAESMTNLSHVYTQEIPIHDYNTYGDFAIASTTIKVDAATGERFKVGILIEAGEINDRSYNFVVVDNIMLENDLDCNNYNMVEFGNFENYSKTPIGTTLLKYNNYWTGTNLSLVNTGSFARYVLKIDPSQTKQATQVVYQATSAEIANYNPASSYTDQAKTYILSGMAKGTYQVVSGDFEIKAFVRYMDGSYENISAEYYYGSNDWQFSAKTFTTKDSVPVQEILVSVVYDNPGIAYFDNIYMAQVADENTVTYEYYETGKVKSQKTGSYVEEYEYDAIGNLIRKTNNRRELYTYTYDSRNLPEAVRYYAGYAEGDELIAHPSHIRTATEYKYDNYNMLRNVTVYEGDIPSKNSNMVDRTPFMLSTYEYDIEPGSITYGMLTRQADASGTDTRYFYNPQSGRLEAVIDYESRTGIHYTYDRLGNIIAVLPATYSYSTGEITKVEDGHHVEYTYDNMHRLSTITTDSTVYRFAYDIFSNADSVMVGNHKIVSYDYYPNNGKLKELHYANGTIVTYEYDELENLALVSYNGEATYRYSYNSAGQLYSFEHVQTGNTIVYQYDASNRLIGYSEYDGADPTSPFTSTILYDDKGRVSSQNQHFVYMLESVLAGSSVKYSYQYDEAGQLDQYYIDYAGNMAYIDYAIDDFGRLYKKEYFLGNSFEHRMIYRYDYPGYSQLAQHTNVVYVTSRTNTGESKTYEYTYNDQNNISKIVYDDTDTVRYSYDDLGQLLREDNELLGKTYLYTYDYAGNITSKKVYAWTEGDVSAMTPIDTYEYGYGNPQWGDLLISYCGRTNAYDAVGNPTRYYNGTQWHFTWSGGRRLSVANNGTVTLSFEYNGDGLRTSKTVNGVKHTYRLNGSQIVSEAWGNHLLIYLYDAEGVPVGMMYRNSTYPSDTFDTFWFEKNLQGDIVAVYNAAGTKLISYTYDAWGNFVTTYHNDCTASDPANFNPYRYRSYYYDAETGLYYLQSRYYDPVIGRFINADKYVSTGQGILSNNMFAYCVNNPVNRIDKTGTSLEDLWDAVVEWVDTGMWALEEIYYVFEEAFLEKVDLCIDEPFNIVSHAHHCIDFWEDIYWCVDEIKQGTKDTVFHEVRKKSLANGLGGLAGGVAVGFVTGTVFAPATGGLSYALLVQTGLAGFLGGYVGTAVYEVAIIIFE